jgi:hypothetical protein
VKKVAPETAVKKVAHETAVKKVAPETAVKKVAPETAVKNHTRYRRGISSFTAPPSLYNGHIGINR